MKRSIRILLTLATVAVCGLLVPVNASAQKETSGVTVKQDGDSIVLIPREAGKVFLVLGCPRAGRGQAPKEGASGSLAEHVGEQRIPAKEYSKVYVLEVQKITELDLEEPSSLQVSEKTTGEAMIPAGKPCACDLPFPPGPEPFRASPTNPGGPVDPDTLGLLISKPLGGAGA